MISVKNLGWRIGNQLFQIATAASLAKDNNDILVLSKPNDGIAWQYQDEFKTEFKSEYTNLPFIWVEPFFHYKKIVYRKNLYISGYFQSEKYFVHNKEYIKELFELKTEFPKTQECAIHVRRGDYAKYPDHHPMLNMNYYSRAIDQMKKIKTDIKFLVFSDDREWCKKHFRLPIYEGKDEIEDFNKMKNCSYHIIANSSFSWWAAWLADSKYVICPKKWFGSAYSHYNLEDLRPESWIQL